MITMFVEGGFVMLPVTLVGALACAAGIAQAAGLGRAEKAAATLRTATFCLAVAGVAVDLRAVGGAVSAAEATDMAAMAAQGLRESLSPLVFAGLLAALSALFGAVGDLRELGRRVV